MIVSLYIGNLSTSQTTEADLLELFKPLGNINEATIVRHPRSHQSLGYGFIELETEKSAEEIVELLNETLLHEHKIVVSQERPLEYPLNPGDF